MFTEKLIGYTSEEWSSANLAIDINSGSWSANSIDFWKMRSSKPDTIDNSLSMVCGVTFKVRIPGDLFRKDDFAIDNRRTFAIGSTEIEANPISFQSDLALRLLSDPWDGECFGWFRWKSQSVAKKTIWVINVEVTLAPFTILIRESLS